MARRTFSVDYVYIWVGILREEIDKLLQSEDVTAEQKQWLRNRLRRPLREVLLGHDLEPITNGTRIVGIGFVTAMLTTCRLPDSGYGSHLTCEAVVPDMRKVFSDHGFPNIRIDWYTHGVTER